MKIPTCLLVISTFFVTPLFQAQASDPDSLIKKRSLDNGEAYDPPKKRRKISKISQSTTQYQNQQQAHNHSSNSTDCCNENALVLEKNAKKEDNNQSSAHDSSHESHSSDEEEDFDIAKERAMIEHLSLEEKIKKFFHRHCWAQALESLPGVELSLINCIYSTNCRMDALTDEGFRYFFKDPSFFLWHKSYDNIPVLVGLMLRNRYEEVKTLLKNGNIDFDVINYVDECKNDETPLTYAIKMHKQDIVELILKTRLVDVNNDYGEMPLEVAVKQVVKVYQKNGQLEGFDIFKDRSMHILRLVLREKPCIFNMSDELREKGSLHLGEWVNKIPSHSDKDKHLYKDLSKRITTEKRKEKIIKALQTCEIVENISNVPDDISKMIPSYVFAICACSNCSGLE